MLLKRERMVCSAVLDVCNVLYRRQWQTSYRRRTSHCSRKKPKGDATTRDKPLHSLHHSHQYGPQEGDRMRRSQNRRSSSCSLGGVASSSKRRRF